MSAIAPAGSNKEWSRSVSSIFNRYLDIEYGFYSKEQDTELEMQIEYEKIKQLKPTIKVEKGGKLVVSGVKIQ